MNKRITIKSKHDNNIITLTKYKDTNNNDNERTIIFTIHINSIAISISSISI